MKLLVSILIQLGFTIALLVYLLANWIELREDNTFFIFLVASIILILVKVIYTILAVIFHWPLPPDSPS